MIHGVSRYLALVLTAALIALVWIALIDPAIAWKRQALHEATRAEASYLRLVSGVRALEQDRAKTQSAPIEIVMWRPAEGRAVMLDVQSALSQLAQETGVTFSTVSPADSGFGSEMEAVALALELRAPLDTVLSFVEAVESHRPPLIIEAATLRRTQHLDFETDFPVVQASFRVAAVTLTGPPEADR